jgi:ferritin-like protein
MRFEQTHEILAHVRDYHKSLSDCYRDLQGQLARQSAKLLLEYLSHRETDLANAIQQFMDEADPGVLDSWFQFADDSGPLDFACPVLALREDMDANDVLAVVQQAHNCLIHVFTEIVDSCETDRVREVFQNLKEQSLRDWQKLVLDTNLLSDW